MNYIRLLTSGNADEFPFMEAALRKLKVNYRAVPTREGGMLFQVPADELFKLPTWNGSPYIPVNDDEGFGVYLEVGDEEEKFC